MTRRKSQVLPDKTPSARELRWLAYIDRHGPQSSELLHACTTDTHRCKDTSLRCLKDLRDANYLREPKQQAYIAKSNFNPKVYDLTAKGFEYLSYHQALERHARPTGHWWHGFWISAVTSAIENHARGAGLEYISATRILKINDVRSAIPLASGKVIPDQFFAIRYPDGYRAFALEVDCGTEPVRSTAARKSLRRGAKQYAEVLQGRLHQRHYGLKCKLTVLWVFQSQSRQKQFTNICDAMSTRQKSCVCVPGFPRLIGLSPAISLTRY